METLAFEGTPEQEKELKAVFKKYENVPGRLMPVLQDAQDIYGYLPIEVQRMIADALQRFTVLPHSTVSSALLQRVSIAFLYALAQLAMLRVQIRCLKKLKLSSELKPANAPLTENSA